MATNTPPLINAESIEAYSPQDRFTINNKGVFFNKISTDKNGDIKETAIQLSSPMDIIGQGKDESGEYYTVIRYPQPENKQPQIMAIARADIGKPNTWGILQGKGITIYAGRAKHEHLADYLQTQGSKTPYHITKKTGWYKGAYILPNGESIAQDKQEAPKAIYIGDTSQAKAYHQKGTLKEWQDNIAKYADGNSRICLALGTALASPLLRIINTAESGGFHIFSDSSDGKSTIGKVGASVWGSPDTKISWNGTALSIINAACSRNDNFILLDEIGEAKQKDVAKIAYSLGNGESKGQGHKDGGNRPIIHFKILFFSTGEKPIDTYVKTGDPNLWNAGQAVRLPSIPADTGAGYGVFDNLHQYADGRAFALHLNQAVNHHYGTAGIEFIEALINDPKHPEKITQLIKEFEATLPQELSSQAWRVAQRFAIVSAALELAGQYSITGLKAGVGATGIKQCFNDWLERNGKEKHEDTQIIKQTIDFFAINITTSSFLEYDLVDEYRLGTRTPISNKTLGYKQVKATDQPIIYYVYPKIFEEQIAHPFEISKVVSVLSRNKWLIKGNRGFGKTQSGKLKGDFYQFNGHAPPNYFDIDDEHSEEPF